MSPIQVRSIAGALETPQIALWSGAVASGKTVASLLAFLILVARAPRTGLIVMCGRTLQTIERNLIDVLQDERLFGDLTKHIHHTKGSTTASILGRTVHLVGANDARSEGRIRGSTICLAYADEATLLPQGFWAMMLSRLRVEGAKLLATTNPDAPAHWLRRDYLLRADEIGMRHWHFTLDDNPGLPEGFAERLKAQYVGLWHRRFISGEWIAGEGSVFDVWDPDWHIVSDLPVIRRWVALGIDYGTVNPFHATLLGLGSDGILYATSEWRWDARAKKRQLTDVLYSEYLREWLGNVPVPGTGGVGVHPEWTVIDPSAASMWTQLHDDGLDPRKGDNSVADGIRLVSSLLAGGQLKIHASCTHLIDEMPSYSWDEKATAKGEDAPVKEADHACFVAGTPVLTEGGERPIEDVRPGDRVLTRDGWKAVDDSGLSSASAKVLRVELSNGREFIGTGNHPVWVDGEGWIRLDSLRYADKMVAWESVSKSSFSTESSSADTQTPRAFPSSVTTRPESETASEASSVSTKRSGCTLTGNPFLRAITSTTPTETTTTTPRATSCASPQTNTWHTTPGSPTTEPRGGSPTWTAFDHWPPRGTVLTPDGHGTPNTGSGLGKAARPSPRPATSVQRTTAPDPEARRIGSARTPANQRGAEPLVSMTSLGSAVSAGTRSMPTSTAELGIAGVRVLAVTEVPGRHPVWNITVADCPEYFASGVLVHNCDSLRYGIKTTYHEWRWDLRDPVHDLTI